MSSDIGYNYDTLVDKTKRANYILCRVVTKYRIGIIIIKCTQSLHCIIDFITNDLPLYHFRSNNIPHDDGN